jgi:chromosome segregation ATPase
MPENALAQAILDEIRGLATRFEQVDGRLSTIEGRLSTIEGRLSSLDGRLSTLENRMSNIEDVAADLDGRIKTWPDMHFLAAATKAQLTHSRELKADVADMKTRFAEVYQAMATDPEIKTLRDEVSRFRDQSLETEVRLARIEGHIGIERILEPRL